MSMVRKYVSKNLLKELQERKLKTKSTKNSDVSFQDWITLDGKDVHWRNQTYSKPQTGPQPIGYKSVRLDGAR